MYYCKDFNSLAVLSLYEGELLGTVDKLYIDKKMNKFCELGLIGENGARLILPTKNIYRVGKNAITVKNNQAVRLELESNNRCEVPISSKVYSITGEFLGVVQEVSFDKKFLTQKIYLDGDSVLDVKNMVTIGKNVIVFNNDNEKVDINNFTPKKVPKEFKVEVEQAVQTMPTTNVVSDVKKENKLPIIQNSNFLLGRVCSKDIFNFNNELLIKAHGVVTKKNLKEINKYGKLRELMLYLK